MDFHFVFKKIEAGAATKCLLLYQGTLRQMLLSELPKSNPNLLKAASSLRPLRTIIPNNTILTLSRKILHYESYKLKKNFLRETEIKKKNLFYT